MIVERDLQRQVQPPGLRAVQVRQRRRVLPRRGTRAASSAASGTTHGDTEVAKDFARNGPSGWLSQTWMSRALQSLTSMKPNACSANSPAVTRWPSVEPTPTTKPTSASKSSRRVGPKPGTSGRAVRPELAAGPGHRGPETTTDRPARGSRPAGAASCGTRGASRAGRSAHGGGVLTRGVEVDVVGHLERQPELDRRLRLQVGFHQRPVAGVGQQFGEAGAGGAPGGWAGGHERVERGRREPAGPGQHPGVGQAGQVEHLIPDRHPHAGRLPRPGEHAVGQVLDREMAALGHLGPGCRARVTPRRSRFPGAGSGCCAAGRSGAAGRAGSPGPAPRPRRDRLASL